MIGVPTQRRCSLCKQPLRLVAIKSDAILRRTFTKSTPFYLCPNCDKV